MENKGFYPNVAQDTITYQQIGSTSNAPPPPPLQVGPSSVRGVCPNCRSEIMTKVVHNATSKTHMFCLLLCCCLCWPCACLPYCMDSCRNANHYCPNCGAFIGTYES